MGHKAALIALERAGLQPKDIDLILFATLSPDYYFPGSGVLVQKLLGIQHVLPWIFACSALALSTVFQPPINSSKQVCIKMCWSLVQKTTLED